MIMTGWTTFLYVLLPHPDQSFVLTQSGLGKTALPNMVYNDRVGIGNTRVLKPLLEELTGAPINILRYVAHHLDEDMRQLYCIHLLELRGGALPQNGLWQRLEKIFEDGDMPLAL